jgi:hypothetical protein
MVGVRKLHTNENFWQNLTLTFIEILRQQRLAALRGATAIWVRAAHMFIIT